MLTVRSREDLRSILFRSGLRLLPQGLLVGPGLRLRALPARHVLQHRGSHQRGRLHCVLGRLLLIPCVELLQKLRGWQVRGRERRHLHVLPVGHVLADESIVLLHHLRSWYNLRVGRGRVLELHRWQNILLAVRLSPNVCGLPSRDVLSRSWFCLPGVLGRHLVQRRRHVVHPMRFGQDIASLVQQLLKLHRRLLRSRRRSLLHTVRGWNVLFERRGLVPVVSRREVLDRRLLLLRPLLCGHLFERHRGRVLPVHRRKVLFIRRVSVHGLPRREVCAHQRQLLCDLRSWHLLQGPRRLLLAVPSGQFLGCLRNHLRPVQCGHLLLRRLQRMHRVPQGHLCARRLRRMHAMRQWHVLSDVVERVLLAMPFGYVLEPREIRVHGLRPGHVLHRQRLHLHGMLSRLVLGDRRGLGLPGLPRG
mmetsp:Transcript_135973/g.434969  ORF Transcript_135973/g.434969 Transcript_135973/m.434969 type:complete len:419 (-) Transcript_135973:424-1680(-)